MKTKTKIFLGVAAAAIAGTIWYMRRSKPTAGAAPIIASPSQPIRSSSLPKPTVIESISYSGSLTKPSTTTVTSQPVLQPVATAPEPVVTKSIVPEQITKVYPAIQPTAYTMPLTKDYYLQLRERSLAGVLL